MLHKTERERGPETVMKLWLMCQTFRNGFILISRSVILFDFRPKVDSSTIHRVLCRTSEGQTEAAIFQKTRF